MSTINEIDSHIEAAIKELCRELSFERGDSNEATTIINNIAKLRASMNPTIVKNIHK